MINVKNLGAYQVNSWMFVSHILLSVNEDLEIYKITQLIHFDLI